MDPKRELELRRRMASGDTRAELELRREMAQTEKSVADDVGPLQAGLISAGRGFVELGRGAKELFGGKVKRDTVEEEAYRKLREKYPLVTAIGEGAPFIAAGGAVGATGRGLGLAANMARQARIGGALGLTMPGTPEERVARGATEAALGAGGEALGRAVTLIPGLGGLGMREVRDPVTRRIINRGRELGFVVLPSSHVQGRLTRQVIEGGLESTPGGAMLFDDIASRNQEVASRILADAIGADPNSVAGGISENVLDSAFKNADEGFGRLMSPEVSVPIDDDLLEGVIRIADDRVAPLIAGPEDPVKRSVDNALRFFERHFDDGMPADKVQAQISRLGYVARSQMRSNPELGRALWEIQDELLRSVRRALPPEQAAELGQVRARYRNLLFLSEGKAVDPQTGAINWQTLANAIERGDKRGWKRGQNQSDFYDTVRLLARVQPPLKSPGTAERSWMGRALATGTVGAAGGYGYDADIQGMLGGAAFGGIGSIAAPWMFGRAYLNPMIQNYMRGVANPLVETMARTGGLGAAQSMSPYVPTYEQNQYPFGLLGQ